MEAAIKEIYIGKSRKIPMGWKTIQTSIFKEPVQSNVKISTLGIIGDTQSDLINHGGVDKAICAYPSEHYPYWKKKLRKNLGVSAFGENLTLIGLTEENVHIGDVYQIGTATLQVSQPRQPCFKIGLKHDEPKLALWVQETGFSGFYFRVLKEGEISKADKLTCLEKRTDNPSVMEVNRAKYHKNPSNEILEKLAQISELTESWRKEFHKKKYEVREGSAPKA